jgi:hypothetical protein
MPNPAKQIVLGAALLVGTIMVANADPLPRTGDKSATSGAAVPSGARQLSGNEVPALPPSDAKPTRDSIKLPGAQSLRPLIRIPTRAASARRSVQTGEYGPRIIKRHWIM